MAGEDTPGGAAGFRAALVNAPAPAGTGDPPATSEADLVPGDDVPAVDDPPVEPDADPPDVDPEPGDDPPEVDEDDPPEDDPDQEIDDDDPDRQPEPEPDPLVEEMHGTTAGQILEAIRSGSLPTELLELPVTVKIDGREKQVPVSEAVQGYQRQSDYTRKTAEASGKVREAEANVTGMQRMLSGWKADKTGAGLRLGLRRMGMADQFFAAAESLANEMDAIGKLEPGARVHALEAKLLREKEEDRAWQAERQQKNEQTFAQRERQATVQRTLEEHTPAALAKYGLKETPNVGKWFAERISMLATDGSVTPEIIDQAAKETAEELDTLGWGPKADDPPADGDPPGGKPGNAAGSPARQQAAAARAGTPSRAVAPRGRAASGAAPAGTKVAGRRGGGRTSEFRKSMAKKNGR